MSQRTRKCATKNPTTDMTTNKEVSDIPIVAPTLPLTEASFDQSLPGDTLTLRDLYALMIATNTNVNKMSSQLNEKINEVSENIKEVKELKVTVQEQSETIKELTEKVVDLGSENTELTARIETLENRLKKIENDKRRFNLIIHNVPEGNGENTRAIIGDLLTDLGTETTLSDCSAIYRLGDKNINRHNSRPILVQLTHLTSKGDIYSKVKRIKDYQRWSRISIVDDLSPKALSRRHVMQHIYIYMQ